MAAEVEYDHFFDAFGNRVVPGDEVVYILGDRYRKRLAKGVVKRIAHNEERYYGKTRYYIRLTEDSDYAESDRLSPMEHTKRIMKLAP